MRTTVVAIVSCSLLFAIAFAFVVRDYLHQCRCQRCARPYAVFIRRDMEVCRTCKLALDALDAARAAWFKARRLNA